MADIISSIPDEILLYILSFLPTKQVVATTILCKRWNLLWRSVPSFDFVYSDDYHWHKEEESYNHFLHSVYSFMHLRDLDQPLRRFSLNCDARLYDPASTDKWVRAAISGRVEHLHFKLLWNVLPSVVFSCKTLVVLKLEFLKVEDIHFFELPLLKILHLYHVYSSEGIHLSQLFAGSPNLEDLEAENTYICHESKFNRLPKLVRANIQAEFVPMEIVKNVEVLFIDWIFQGDLDSCFHNLVQLELKTLQHTEEWPLEVLEILKHCPKLQTLALYIYNKDHIYSSDESHEGEVWPYPQPVPQCISLYLKTCRLVNYKGCIDEFQFARSIMQNAEYLRTMKIRVNRDSTPEEKLDMIRDLSSCVKSSDTCKLSLE